jgi:ADP-ribose pyrophosphatase
MENLKWQKLSTKYLVKEKWATLRVDTCKMPGGQLVDDYYVLEYSDWVNAVAITEDNQVILITQYRHGAEEVITEIPGGCIDPGETPEEAVRRELLEETGYTFASIEPLVSLYANPSTSKNKTFSFLATGGVRTHDQQLDGREEILVNLVSLQKLKELLLTNQIPQALHASALFYALSRMGEL